MNLLVINLQTVAVLTASFVLSIGIIFFAVQAHVRRERVRLAHPFEKALFEYDAGTVMLVKSIARDGSITVRMAHAPEVVVLPPSPPGKIFEVNASYVVTLRSFDGKRSLVKIKEKTPHLRVVA